MKTQARIATKLHGVTTNATTTSAPNTSSPRRRVACSSVTPARTALAPDTTMNRIASPATLFRDWNENTLCSAKLIGTDDRYAAAPAAFVSTPSDINPVHTA